MGKRGRLKFEDSADGRIMPLRVVAERLGISLRTADKDYRSAMNKLRRIPGAFEIILSAIHAVDASEHDMLRCSSVECNPAFIELFGDVE